MLCRHLWMRENRFPRLSFMQVTQFSSELQPCTLAAPASTRKAVGHLKSPGVVKLEA